MLASFAGTHGCFSAGFAYADTMNTLPVTSPDHYLTGQAALNIPMEDGRFADWHFSEVFLSGRGRFQIAGENFPDTANFLGDYGIRECSDVLRRHGLVLPDGTRVFAASPVRATLDLVLSAVSRGKVPLHVTLDDTLDDSHMRQDFNHQLQSLKRHISDRVALSLLEQWEAKQS